MAKFEVYRLVGEATLVVDCQANLLDDLATRFVAPLLPETDLPQPLARLNPRFVIAGRSFIMTTQLASGIPVRELDARVASLLDEQDAIVNALDMLICGF
jgi:toxin CcdB